MPTTLDPRMINPEKLLSINNTIVNTSLTAENTISNFLQTTDLTVTDEVVTNFLTTTITSDYVLNESDKSKIFHVDTTTTPLITISFPDNLTNGYNVGLVNIGTGTVLLSTDGSFNSPGTTNTAQYTSMLIYKTDNEFYGVGTFE
jgi:hypothetical protein